MACCTRSRPATMHRRGPIECVHPHDTWCLATPMHIERSILDALDQLIVAAVGTTTMALAEANAAGELTFPQWRVLVVIGETPSGLHVSEIAGRIGSSSPSASRLIRRMERAGLVKTERDERD